MKGASTLIFCLFIFSITNGQEHSKKELNYQPTTLNEAVDQLKIIHHDSTKQEIMKMTEEEFLGGAHFGLGMWMRNNWGLWKGKELGKHFNAMGIYHPDDMSGIILTSYYRELKGLNWDIDNQVKYYQDYWKKSNDHNYKLETDPAYKKEIQAQQDSLERESFEQKKREWSPNKKVSGYVDHRCGILKDFALRTKIEGAIIEWKEEVLVLKIDKYEDIRKKKRIIKYNNIKNDIIEIEKHQYFRLIEE